MQMARSEPSQVPLGSTEGSIYWHLAHAREWLGGQLGQSAQQRWFRLVFSLVPWWHSLYCHEFFERALLRNLGSRTQHCRPLGIGFVGPCLQESAHWI